MKIKKKLILQAICLAVIPALVLCTIITLQANKSSYEALEKKTTDRLISLRELKKAQIGDYISNIESQVISLSNNLAVKDAAANFIASFHQQEVSSTQLQHSVDIVSRYYKNDFHHAFQQKNNTASTSVTEKLAALDNQGLFFQNKYIASNRFPLGEKAELIQAGNSPYDNVHAQYHPMFSDYLKRFGFYDIFLVDANSGHIVYSVFKELDYATSLISGPYRNTGIAKVFNRALTLDDNEQAVLEDFASYYPSYDQAASFIASPITDTNGKVSAVLIFQMPIDGINNIMTNNQQWRSVGLGNSGETYLVGPDHTLRSESRFLIEDKENYYKALQAATNQPNLDQIKAYQSALGLQLVDTTGTKSALNGQTGFAQFADYRDVDVLSAYAPIQYGNHTWAIMAEIDVDEAFADAIALSNELYRNAIIVLVIIAVISVSIGLIIAHVLVTPLNTLVERIDDISQGDGDLTVELSLAQRDDEVGQVGKSFNLFVSKIRAIIREIDSHANQLAASSEELSAVTRDTSEVVTQQKSKTQTTSQVVTEFSEDIRDIANNSLETAELTDQANNQSTDGAKISINAEQSIYQLVDSINKASHELSSLNVQVEEITEILGVIETIADQTNLLALNAAIEAARAGESGRGFSVVADEVRTLAGKTQESTVEIQKKIEALKASSGTSVNAMNDAAREANKGIDLVKSTAENLQSVAKLMSQVNQKNQENATVAKHQSESIGHVHNNIIDIANYTESTASASLQTSQASDELARLAVNMSSIVQQFKY